MRPALFHTTALLLALGLLRTTALAAPPSQATEAARYVNAQGIEVIQARANNPVADQSALNPTPVATPAPPRRSFSVANGAANIAQAFRVSNDPKLHISAREQSARDRDRLTILQQELMKELTAYEQKTRLLKRSAINGAMPKDEIDRLREVTIDHEKNIRALNAEIKGAELATSRK